MTKKITTLEGHRKKKCYGTNRCWGNVKKWCPVREECAEKAGGIRECDKRFKESETVEKPKIKVLSKTTIHMKPENNIITSVGQDFIDQKKMEGLPEKPKKTIKTFFFTKPKKMSKAKITVTVKRNWFSFELDKLTKRKFFYFFFLPLCFKMVELQLTYLILGLQGGYEANPLMAALLPSPLLALVWTVGFMLLVGLLMHKASLMIDKMPPVKYQKYKKWLHITIVAAYFIVLIPLLNNMLVLVFFLGWV